MKYARIENGYVVELVALDDAIDIADAFHPSLVFVQSDDAQLGDEYNGGVFQRPIPPAPTTADIQAQIDAIERETMTNRGARELHIQILRREGQAMGLVDDAAIAAKVPYFAKLVAIDTQIRALRSQL